MRAWYSDDFVLPLPPGHRFPMEKYARLRARVEEERLARELLVPSAATDEQLALAHDPDYVRRATTGGLSDREIRALGFPWTPALVERSRRSAGATMAAARAALEDGVGVNLAGGTHHAFRDRGEGYCLFNDAAVAVRVLRLEGMARKVLVVDLDVHQGNGTASILAGDAGAFTFSVHGRHNFPLRKERSDLDVELPDGCADEPYLEAVRRGLSEALDRARPDLAIYLAGADPFEDDRLGRLAVTKAGLAARDALVFDACRALGLPVAVAMAGGYARDVDDAVEIHLETVRQAARLAR